MKKMNQIAYTMFATACFATSSAKAFAHTQSYSRATSGASFQGALMLHRLSANRHLSRATNSESLNQTQMMDVSIALLTGQIAKSSDCINSAGRTDFVSNQIRSSLQMVDYRYATDMKASRIQLAERSGYKFVRSYGSSDDRMVTTVLLSRDGREVEYIKTEEFYLSSQNIGSLVHPEFKTTWVSEAWTECKGINF